jgi:hypothetical protein
MLVLEFPEQREHSRLRSIRRLKMRQGGLLSLDDIAKNLWIRELNHDKQYRTLPGNSMTGFSPNTGQLR